MRITRRYMRGHKSTTLRTSRLVYDPVDNDYYAEWVWNEERDRRHAPQQREAYQDFKRLMGASRSS